MTAANERTYTLSSIPPFAGDCTLLVGVEEQEDGSVKAYLGARHKGVYLHVHADEAEGFRRAWRSASGHIWLYPVPPRDLLRVDAGSSQAGEQR